MSHLNECISALVLPQSSNTLILSNTLLVHLKMLTGKPLAALMRLLNDARVVSSTEPCPPSRMSEIDSKLIVLLNQGRDMTPGRFRQASDPLKKHDHIVSGWEESLSAGNHH